ncbi:MAG: hypothetical protein HONBIEJF_01692 [Fimbriimonadaceae bacterium]|nr:hypothetical protein [Fimbriimonadaceae bacterium]
MSRVEVFEDRVELQCESASIQPIDPSKPESLVRYPLPTLAPSGSIQGVVTPVVVLENAYLQASFAPQLGGRLLTCFDRRTQSRLLPERDQLRLSGSWPRGAGLPDGILPVVGRALHSLGPIDYLVREWEDGGASVLFHGLEMSDGLSWHATWTLASNQARLSLDFRALNRSKSPVAAPIGLHIGGAQGHWDGKGRLAARIGDNVWLVSVEVGGDFLASSGDDSEVLWYFAGHLAPHQTISFQVDLTPFSGMPAPVALTRNAAMSLSNTTLRVQSAAADAAKLFLLTEDEETLETSVSLMPEVIREFDLSAVEERVVKVALVGSDRKVLAESDLLPLEWTTAPLDHGPTEEAPLSGSWQEWTKSAAMRAAGWHQGALEAMRTANWDMALERIDEALLYAGDDHILWWLRAVVERRTGIGESQSLTNAHYLAPLEPLLRIESFLRQPPGGSEPAAIIRPIGQNGDALVEGAARLIDAGLDDDAIRWIDEALRHQDLALLRYFAAWRLGDGANKVTEAAIHVRAAENLPSDLPLPAGELAWRCIAWLALRFPDSPRLKKLAELGRALSQMSDQ